MQYLEVTIKTASTGIEPVAEALTAWGFDSLVIDDQLEYQKFLEDNRACWDYIDEALARRLEGLSQIKLYLQQDQAPLLPQLQDRLLQLRSAHPDLELGPLTVSVAPLEEEDWSNTWKKNYPAQNVGRRLCVLPYWMRREEAGDRIPVILDPGLTFGTGFHPSTQMCMAALEEYLLPGFRVVDLGSGSGILSIAALRLGAESALGVDIDPKAEDMARENAAYNGFFPPQFQALTGDVAKNPDCLGTPDDFDLVLINIVADVILTLCPVLPKLVRPGGFAILSGILDVRLPEVLQQVQQQGLTLLEIRAQEDWRCLVAQRKKEG